MLGPQIKMSVEKRSVSFDVFEVIYTAVFLWSPWRSKSLYVVSPKMDKSGQKRPVSFPVYEQHQNFKTSKKLRLKYFKNCYLGRVHHMESPTFLLVKSKQQYFMTGSFNVNLT